MQGHQYPIQPTRGQPKCAIIIPVRRGSPDANKGNVQRTSIQRSETAPETIIPSLRRSLNLAAQLGLISYLRLLRVRLLCGRLLCVGLLSVGGSGHLCQMLLNVRIKFEKTISVGLVLWARKENWLDFRRLFLTEDELVSTYVGARMLYIREEATAKAEGKHIKAEPIASGACQSAFNRPFRHRCVRAAGSWSIKLRQV